VTVVPSASTNSVPSTRIRRLQVLVKGFDIGPGHEIAIPDRGPEQADELDVA